VPYVETVGIAITYLLSLDWKELQQCAYEELSNCFSPPPQTGQFSLVTYLDYCDWYSVVDIIHLYIYIYIYIYISKLAIFMIMNHMTKKLPMYNALA